MHKDLTRRDIHINREINYMQHNGKIRGSTFMFSIFAHCNTYIIFSSISYFDLPFINVSVIGDDNYQNILFAYYIFVLHNSNGLSSQNCHQRRDVLVNKMFTIRIC